MTRLARGLRCLALAAALLGAGRAGAQEHTSSREPSVSESIASESPHRHQRGLCWSGRPLAECRSFLLTEFGVLARLDENPYQPSSTPVTFTFDLGWMKNVSENEAVGFSGYALVSDPATRLGVRGRYRRWLSRRLSVDVAPGILLGGEDNVVEYSPPGFVLGASINAGDLIALTVDAEYSRNKDYGDAILPLNPQTRTDVAWRAGAKLGSGLGVLGAAGLIGLFLYIGLSGGFE